ncbi:unnamed protein product [Rotaria sordida]|uniref:Uncharacterized protein n=1 Tax=Rotaria sordida TaxID=392033 RepID=A0A819DA22_9BILA|nr:unnamed protein product [Rotaria sordida]
MGKSVSPDLSKAESDSIHRHRHVQSPSSKNQGLSVISNSQPDVLNSTLPTVEVTLQRHLGLFSGVCFIVGVIIGSGIFISPKGVLEHTHSVGACLIVWAICGLLALLGALCYAEIGTVIPRNGAEVAYLKEGIGSVHERTGDVLAYLFNWTNAIILRPASLAVLTLTFSEYFLAGVMDDCGPPSELVQMFAIFTIRHTKYLENGFAGTTKNPLGIAFAFYSGLWAYDGWNSLNTVTEELKNPQRDLWLSIALALPAVTVLYVLTNISYFTVLSKAALLSSTAVAVTWGEVILGRAVRALLILISISALGSANGTLIAAARYSMVGAQYGYLPEIPIPLIVVIILISIYLVIAPVISKPSIGLLVATTIMLVGLVFYYPFVYRKMELNIMTESNSIHRHRPDQSPITEHQHVSITSSVQSNVLKVVLIPDEPTLKRHLGLFSGVCFIIGIIIGSGIFISPKGVLQETQSVGLCLIVWTACGLISILGALCYAEIGTIIPRNGAEVAYMKEGIGSVHERTGDILAYLFVWTSVLVIKPASIAVGCLTFSQYFLSGILNIGLVRIGQGHTQSLQNSFAGTTKKPFGVVLAFYKGLYAFGGWHNLNTVTEELKNPKRNLWLSIVLALPCVIILYILTNISYFTAMNKVELLNSNAVAVTWGEVALGSAVRVLVIFISISALGAANISLFGAARYCMVGAQYRYLPEFFACVQTQRLTPLPGVVLVVVSSI